VGDGKCYDVEEFSAIATSPAAGFEDRRRAMCV
jgi:hypothetical protein